MADAPKKTTTVRRMAMDGFTTSPSGIIGGFRPTTSQSATPPKTVSNQPSSVQPPATAAKK